jgi:hypothetical protein
MCVADQLIFVLAQSGVRQFNLFGGLKHFYEPLNINYSNAEIWLVLGEGMRCGFILC